MTHVYDMFGRYLGSHTSNKDDYTDMGPRGTTRYIRHVFIRRRVERILIGVLIPSRSRLRAGRHSGFAQPPACQSWMWVRTTLQQSPVSFLTEYDAGGNATICSPTASGPPMTARPSPEDNDPQSSIGMEAQSPGYKARRAAETSSSHSPAR